MSDEDMIGSRVRLRVVGIYYRLDVSLGIYAPDSMTSVLDLLNAAVKQDPNLTVKFSQKGSVSSFSYKWTTPPPTLSGIKRPAGLYAINENLPTNPATAWQYYVERPLPGNMSYRKLVSKTKIGGGFTIPAKSPPLLPGDEVIFRCVSIATAPA